MKLRRTILCFSLVFLVFLLLFPPSITSVYASPGNVDLVLSFTAPDSGYNEGIVYAVINSSLYWGVNYGGGTEGNIYKTDLTTNTTSTIHVGNYRAEWQGLKVGNKVYSVGEERDAEGTFRASVHIVDASDDSVTEVLHPDTGGCNEFIGVASNGTVIVAGERITGGITTGSSYPNGGGVWEIPLSTITNTTTWTRKWEDPNLYEWVSIAYFNSKWYGFLYGSSGEGKWRVVSSANLTTWSTELNYTAQTTGPRGSLTVCGDKLVALGAVEATNTYHMFVFDGASWTDYDLGLSLNYGIKGIWLSEISKLLIGINKAVKIHDVYTIDLDGTNLSNEATDLSKAMNTQSNMGNHTNYNGDKFYGVTADSGGTGSVYKVEIAYAPTIEDFEAPDSVTSDSWFYLNATINDPDGDFNYAQVELSGGIVLKWAASGNIFTLYSDPNLYCVLNASDCLRQTINSTAYKLSWRIQLTFWTPTGSVDVVSATVEDNGGLTGTNSQTGLFTLSKGTTYTDTSTDFTIESSSSISNVTWDATPNILTFYTEGNIVVEVGTYETPTTVEVDDVEWTDWTFVSSAKNVTIKGVSSKVELIWITYRYTFKGPYDEETGLLSGNVTVTAYSFNGEGTSFELNDTNSHTYVLNFTYPPHCFQFELTDSMKRYYYPSASQETVYVWNITENAYHYNVTFKDTVGFIDASTYVQVERYVNGSTRILERIPVQRDVAVSLWLHHDRPYRLRLVSSTEERVVEMLADDDLTKELVISGITFTDQVKLAYRYVRVEAVRETGSKITINYEDTLQQTVSVYFEIQYRNGTQVWNATLTSSKGSVSWSGADPETGYVVKATIDHSGMGSLTFTYAVPPLPQADNPFDIAWAGNLPISTKAVIPVIAVWFVAACFSTLTAGAGIIITVISAGILYYMEWLDIQPAILTIALAFALIFAISLAKRRGVD